MSNIVPRIGNLALKNRAMRISSNNDNSATSFKDVLAADASYEVARFKVPARCTLPLTNIAHTSRHITILSGIVHVTLGEDILVLVADESVYVPQGVVHGLENRANDVALVIAVDYTA